MKNVIFFFICLFSATMFAQTKNNDASPSNNNTLERKGFTIDLGSAYSTFQDVRFSRAQFGGIGAGLGLGLVKRTEDRERRVGMRFDFTNMGTSLNDVASIKKYRVELGYDQQRPVGELFGGQWLVGGELATYTSLYSSSDSGNNSTQVIYDVGLTALSTVRLPIKNNTLSITAGLGIVHFGNDNTSFAFSAAQSWLEDGEFTYEGSSGGEPYGAPKFSLIGGPLDFRTKFNYQFGRKFGVVYDWRIKRYTGVKDYPTTIGHHRLGVSFTF